MTQVMKMMNNIISAAAALLLFAAAPSLTAQDLVILHTNDTHSQIEEVRTGKGAGTGGVHRRAEYFQQVRTTTRAHRTLRSLAETSRWR